MPPWQGSTPLHKSSGNLNSLRLVESSVCTFRVTLSAWAWGTMHMRYGVQRRGGDGEGLSEVLRLRCGSATGRFCLHPLLPDLVT